MADLPFPCQGYAYGEDPGTWVAAFRHGFQQAGFPVRPRIGIEPRQLRVLEYSLLQSAAPEADFIPAEETLAGLALVQRP